MTLLLWLTLLPFDLTLPSPKPPVYPTRGNGFAAGVLGGFFGLGIIIFALIALSRRPPTRRRE